MASFKIFSSSAGSGKTFTLTKEYLKLILVQANDPTYFKKVLAITFTNDAASEMKNRILGALKDFAEKNGKSANLMSAILAEQPELSEVDIEFRANAIYLEIIHNYSDFSVKTIDSFINQLVSSFSFDLNLPYNYEIRLDTENVISECVDRLLDKIGTKENEDLSEIVSDFTMSIVEDGKSIYTISELLGELGRDLSNDDSFAQISRNENLKQGDYKKIKANIDSFLFAKKNAVKSLSGKAMELITFKGLDDKDFYYGKSGVFSFFNNLSQNPELLFIDDDYPKSRHVDAFENGKWYKIDKKIITANPIDDISDELTIIANEILEFRIYRDKYRILSQVKGNIQKISFLVHLSTEMKHYLQERNEVFLSDFNRMILNIVIKEPMPFIYERIGEIYRHLLIDEFQDTSNIQFFNFLPLLDNALANDGFSMIVGDPKQSIYSWRGGNIKLMIDLIEKNDFHLKENKETSQMQFDQIDSVLFSAENQSLKTNFRSTKEVITFNNSFFSFLSNHLKPEFPLIENVFEDINQEIAENTKSGGWVSIEFLESSESDDFVLSRVLERVSALIAEGWQLGDIAILCRKNKEASFIASKIQNKGYEVSSPDSLKLKFNNEINFIISCLWVFQFPSDKFRKFEAIMFLKNAKPNIENISIEQLLDLENADFFEALKMSTFEFGFEWLEQADFFEKIEIVVNGFKLLDNSQSIDFVLTFMDIALAYFQKDSMLLIDFLNHWEQIKPKAAIRAQNKNAIIVSTIHKSKGLEYPVVILPYATWDTKPNVNSRLWQDTSMLGYPELTGLNESLQSCPFSLSEKFKDGEIWTAINTEIELKCVEEINMLYVAFTRPIFRLYVFSEVKKDKVKGVGEYLKLFIEKAGIIDIEPLKYVFYDGNYIKPQLDNEEITSEIIIDEKHKYLNKNPLKLKKDATYKNIDESRKIEIGNLIHGVFEKIFTKEDVPLAINNLEQSGMLLNDQVDEFKSKIYEVVNHPEISFLFEKKGVIRNEIEILGGGMSPQRPDRVVFLENAVYIIDYKTGDKSNKHLSQLHSYGKLLTEIGYEKVYKFLIYLDPLEVIKL